MDTPEPIPLYRKLVVEAIGTFFLVLTVGLAVGKAGQLAPLAIGLVLMVMVFAGGHVSGAHFNPAVSTAAMLRGALDRSEYPAYVGVQLVAGVVAALVVVVLGYDFDEPGDLAGAGRMLVAEFLFTFALAWVVLNVATTDATDGNSYFGLAIGLTVAAGAFAVGTISGGAFNPAVALGAMVMGLFSWGDIWIYPIAEIAGAVAAAAAFAFTQPGEVRAPERERGGRRRRS